MKKPRSPRKMPAFTKAPPETIAHFDRGLEGLEDVERRTMFSYPSAFANGNMFACVFQDRIMVRLAPADRDAALALAGARLFEPSPGRAMREYVELPPSVLGSLPKFRSWMSKAKTYAASLPAKSRKARR